MGWGQHLGDCRGSGVSGQGNVRPGGEQDEACGAASFCTSAMGALSFLGPLQWLLFRVHPVPSRTKVEGIRKLWVAN